MSFKVLIVTVLAVTLVQATRIHSHQQGDEERDGLKFMSKVAKEVQKDPQVAALIKAGKTEGKTFDKLVNQKTLDAIKKNPEYKKSFRDGFLKGNPFGDSLSKEEANKVIDFLLSDPDLLNKSEKDFNKAAAAALPEIDKKWKAFSKELRH